MQAHAPQTASVSSLQLVPCSLQKGAEDVDADDVARVKHSATQNVNCLTHLKQPVAVDDDFALAAKHGGYGAVLLAVHGHHPLENPRPLLERNQERRMPAHHE